MARAKTRYTDYYGARQYQVQHPRYPKVTVTAPDESSAIVTAAGLWGVKWTRLDIYMDATVCRA